MVKHETGKKMKQEEMSPFPNMLAPEEPKPLPDWKEDLGALLDHCKVMS